MWFYESGDAAASEFIPCVRRLINMLRIVEEGLSDKYNLDKQGVKIFVKLTVSQSTQSTESPYKNISGLRICVHTGESDRLSSPAVFVFQM